MGRENRCCCSRLDEESGLQEKNSNPKLIMRRKTPKVLRQIIVLGFYNRYHKRSTKPSGALQGTRLTLPAVFCIV
jgi:hypothetical protein